MIDSGIPQRIFITGTDTGVGKTVVSAILMAGLKGQYWKPIQSGLEEITDTDWIRNATGLPEDHFLPETYRLNRPLSPHASAVLDGVRIDLNAFAIPQTEECLIVEGAGGIMVPLNEKDLMVDLIKLLSMPTILVARTELGTINHTLLSLAQLRRHEIEVLGVVMNGPKNQSNREAVEHFGKVKVLAEVEPMTEISFKRLRGLFLEFTGLEINHTGADLS